ncbi:alpha/beta hydrolase [Flavonifractor sp. AGMB03687]|uniref:alpha/beta hydrolase n=1 Tax=Flavonifractor sp. AGMB03687 TaxID=2785133 RepID=UPI001AE0A514|nr:alpha/beta hydrolase [Flavonifractor sp. AGMB03687]
MEQKRYQDPFLRSFVKLLPSLRSSQRDAVLGQPLSGLSFSVPCDGREIPVWIHPARSAGRPALFELHGGGFVLGDAEKCDGFCELLAQELDITVVAIGYRLAPEFPYPAAVEDVYEVVRWFSQHPQTHSIDPHRMMVMGYSAGANLATVCAMLAKERGEFSLCGQILCYPYLDSVHAPGEKPHFESDMDPEVMEAFSALYCTQAQRSDPHVSPVCASLAQLRGVCPALVLLAEHDALKPEGEHYIRLLQQAGVPVDYRILNQTHHGFLEDWANRAAYE